MFLLSLIKNVKNGNGKMDDSFESTDHIIPSIEECQIIFFYRKKSEPEYSWDNHINSCMNGYCILNFYFWLHCLSGIS